MRNLLSAQIIQNLWTTDWFSFMILNFHPLGRNFINCGFAANGENKSWKLKTRLNHLMMTLLLDGTLDNVMRKTVLTISKKKQTKKTTQLLHLPANPTAQRSICNLNTFCISVHSSPAWGCTHMHTSVLILLPSVERVLTFASVSFRFHWPRTQSFISSCGAKLKAFVAGFFVSNFHPQIPPHTQEKARTSISWPSVSEMHGRTKCCRLSGRCEIRFFWDRRRFTHPWRSPIVLSASLQFVRSMYFRATSSSLSFSAAWLQYVRPWRAHRTRSSVHLFGAHWDRSYTNTGDKITISLKSKA